MVSDLDSKKILQVLEAKAESLRWNHPVSFESDFVWAWDSLYFVDPLESNWDIPRGSREFIDKDDYGEDYMYIFFTVSDTITSVARIHNSEMKIVFNPCHTLHHGYGRASEFYVTKDCIPPKIYLSILPSDCDSATVYKYVCPSR